MRFVFVLYNGNTPYVVEALNKISALRIAFDDARFCILFDRITAEKTLTYFQFDYVDTTIIEASWKNRHVLQLLRFAVIFDEKYLQEDMAIVDVHDHTQTVVSACSKYLKQLRKLQKDVVFAYVHSSDENCFHEASLHKTRHTHRDAGFSVWRASAGTRAEISKSQKFTEFLSFLQKTYGKYEYGADEVILDVFFNRHIPKECQTLIKNPFPSRRCSSVQRVRDAFTPVTPHIKVDFNGKESMYICSRI